MTVYKCLFSNLIVFHWLITCMTCSVIDKCKFYIDTETINNIFIKLFIFAVFSGADKQNNNNSIERPTSLALNEQNAAQNEKVQGQCQDPSQMDMNKYKDPKYACTYMEIPQRDSSAEKDVVRPPPPLQTPPERDVPPPEEAQPGMAFTIDMGGDDDKKLSMAGSLSNFLPSKVRKSFRTRLAKTKSQDQGQEAKSQDQGQEAKDDGYVSGKKEVSLK